jgi:hypothetical protein
MQRKMQRGLDRLSATIERLDRGMRRDPKLELEQIEKSLGPLVTQMLTWPTNPDNRARDQSGDARLLASGGSGDLKPAGLDEPRPYAFLYPIAQW